MPYRSPTPTFGTVKKTLASGYGVKITQRIIAPGTKGQFTAVHWERMIGDDGPFEAVCKDRPDDIPMSWYEVESICRSLRIDPDHDGLFGVL